MEINTNMNVSGVNGLIPPGRSAAVAKTAPDTASFTGSAGVEAALEALPASRPEAVERAKQMINDAGYPSSQMVKQLSEFLASKLKSENEQF
jgi:predicted outer membrane protein